MMVNYGKKNKFSHDDLQTLKTVAQASKDEISSFNFSIKELNYQNHKYTLSTDFKVKEDGDIDGMDEEDTAKAKNNLLEGLVLFTSDEDGSLVLTKFTSSLPNAVLIAHVPKGKYIEEALDEMHRIRTMV